MSIEDFWNNDASKTVKWLCYFALNHAIKELHYSVPTRKCHLVISGKCSSLVMENIVTLMPLLHLNTIGKIFTKNLGVYLTDNMVV